jgi:hypothetical protein
MAGKVIVQLYTVPQEACDSKKMNWTEAALLLQGQLHQKLGDQVDFRHVEFMTEGWFQDEAAQQLLEEGHLNFPFVLVDGELADAGAKINVSRVLRKAEQRLTAI